MKKYCFSIAVWLTLALLLYFSADIAAKGQALNQITPFPVLGYVLWSVVLGLVWWLLVQPILDFWLLARKSHLTVKDRAKALHRRLSRYISSHGDNSNCLPDAGREAYAELDEALKRKQWDELKPIIKKCLPYDTLREQANAMVLAHSRAAALAVAFSHNSLLDGFCMLVIQMKLVVALARLYGYRPSPVFNTCCFAWVAANSIVAALLNTALDSVAENAVMALSAQGKEDLAAASADGAKDVLTEQLSADTAAENVSDAITEDGFSSALSDLAMGGGDNVIMLGAEAVGQRIASFTISMLLEAIIAGSAVYVTGQIFRSKLDGEWEKPTFKSLVDLRRKGRFELGKSLMGMSKTLFSRATNAGGEVLTEAFTKLRKCIFG